MNEATEHIHTRRKFIHFSSPEKKYKQFFIGVKL